MAVALGFNGIGNKNDPMSGSTGGGGVQPRLQLNAQGQPVTNGTGGLSNAASGAALNYLKSLGGNAASGAAADYGGELAAGGAGGAAAAGW